MAMLLRSRVIALLKFEVLGENWRIEKKAKSLLHSGSAVDDDV